MIGWESTGELGSDRRASATRNAMRCNKLLPRPQPRLLVMGALGVHQLNSDRKAARRILRNVAWNHGVNSPGSEGCKWALETTARLQADGVYGPWY